VCLLAWFWLEAHPSAEVNFALSINFRARLICDCGSTPIFLIILGGPYGDLYCHSGVLWRTPHWRRHVPLPRCGDLRVVGEGSMQILRLTRTQKLKADWQCKEKSSNKHHEGSGNFVQGPRCLGVGTSWRLCGWGCDCFKTQSKC
jgi:hypothetical protein